MLGNAGRLFLNCRENRADFLGRLSRTDRKLADLVGDDRKAAAVIASASRFDCGIEREQIRLVGDLVDRVNDLFDCDGALDERVHRLRALRSRNV